MNLIQREWEQQARRWLRGSYQQAPWGLLHLAPWPRPTAPDLASSSWVLGAASGAQLLQTGAVLHEQTPTEHWCKTMPFGFACAWSLSFHCWRANARLSLRFKFMVVSFSAVRSFSLTAPVLMTSFLYFQTVAEVVKELEKNEKIRVQLEFNKTSENVS